MMQLVAFLVLCSPLMGALAAADILQVTSENPDPGLAGNRSGLTDKPSSAVGPTSSSSSTRLYHGLHQGLHPENRTQKFDVKNYFRLNSTRLGSNNATDQFGYKRYTPPTGEQPPQQTVQASFSSPYKPHTYPSGITAPTLKSTNILTTKVTLPPVSLFLFSAINQKTTPTTSTSPSTSTTSTSTTSPISTPAMANMMQSGVPCAGNGAALGALQPLVVFLAVTVTLKMANNIF